MKKTVLALFATLVLPLLSYAQETSAQAAQTIDQKINAVFAPITKAIESVVFVSIPLGEKLSIPFVLIWLVVGALVFTIYMGFIQFRSFGHAIDVVRGKFDDPNDPGEVSHFQALTAALSGTVGVGNIAGVAFAVAIGGPGATFWMILAGLLGMASKFVECTLGVMYRNVNADGSVSGGPMYYLEKGFKEKGSSWGKLGKVLAVLFAVACIGGSLGGGNMVQINQATIQLIDVTGGDYESGDVGVLPLTYQGENILLNEIATIEQISKKEIHVKPNDLANIELLSQTITASDARIKLSVDNGTIVTTRKISPLSGQGWIFGVVMAFVVGIVIIGGIKSIAKVTDKIVPFMVGIYVAGALVVLGYHFADIPAAFGTIFSSAFSGDALYGGFIGVLIQGFRRAAFSNEAGVGSASIAHSAVKTDEPISEGIVALLEPFIDTVVICTMTALVIVVTNYGGVGAESSYYGREVVGDIGLTSNSFASVISWFPTVLGVAVILFALSTMISWSYYGLKSWTYIFGESKTNEVIYKVLFCGFVVVGSAISAKAVFDFGDAMIFAMCFPNVFGLYVLMPNVRRAFRDYMKRIKSGEIARID